MRYLIIIVIFAGLAAAGCSPEAKYKMLGFWIDGVPNPEEILGSVSDGTASRERQQKKQFEVYVHGPYGAKLCTACHEGGFSNRLLFPREDLCLTCHEFDMSAKWIHGPLAGGGCLVCHDPHNSRFKYLLVGKAEEFCFFCHDKVSVLKGKRHAEAMDEGCTTCHDAHMSNRKFLLKKGVDFIETSEASDKQRIM